jgi:hypothetical protein
MKRSSRRRLLLLQAAAALLFGFSTLFLQAQPMQTRALSELVNTEDPAWPLVQG